MGKRPDTLRLGVRNGMKIRVWLLNNSKVIHESGALSTKPRCKCTHRWPTMFDRVNNDRFGRMWKKKKFKDHTLMHCFVSILHPLAFYFYSSSSYNPENLWQDGLFALIFAVKKLQEAWTTIRVPQDSLCSGGN